MKKLALLVVVLLVSTISLLAQRTVVGKVSDSDGEPLTGANVVVKGTSTGATTDLDGNYSVNVPSNGTTIVITYTGFNTQEIVLGVSNVVNVSMSEGVILAETVVTALGNEEDKAKSGTASTKVGGDALRSSAEVGILNSLAGKSAGVNITSSTGDPGAGSRIQIRGASSITGNVQPLVILDGIAINNDSYYGTNGSSSYLGTDGGVVQQSRLNDIPAEEIENVEVLRGASAAAIWGSAAANGVLVITTKKGKSAGRKGWTVDLNSSVAFDQINKTVDLQNEYGGGNNGVFQFNPAGGRSWGDRVSDRTGGADVTNQSGAYFQANSGTKYYPIADGDAANVHGGKNDKTLYGLYDQLFKTGTTYTNNISLNNIDNRGNVYFSLSNLKQDGIIKENSNYQRTNARLNVIRKLTDKVTIDVSTGYTQTNSDRIQMGSNLSGLFLGGLRTPIDFNSEDYVGTYFNAGGVPTVNSQRAYRNPIGANPVSTYDNPLWMMENINSKSRVGRFIGRGDIRYEPTNWLSFTGRAGLDAYNDNRSDFFPFISAGSNNKGAYTRETINGRDYNYMFFGTVKAPLADFLKSALTIGTNLTEQNFETTATISKGFINPNSPPVSANAADQRTRNYSNQQRTIRYFGKLGLEFWDQLYVNGSASLDYLSTLSESENGVFYPAVDVAWNVNKYIKMNEVSTVKLRGGWGQVGRGPVPYVATTGFYIPNGASSFGFNDGWGSGLDPNAYGGGVAINSVAGNPAIRPEIKTEIEYGIDLGFFNDRIKFGGTVYSNVTKDLILQVPVSESAGFDRQFSNIAEIENKGVELEFGFTPIKKKDLTWNIYGNWSRNKNEVTKLGVDNLFLGGFEGSSSYAAVGQQLGVIWGTKFDRDNTGKLVLDDNGFPVQAEVEGVLGDPNPDFRMGIGTTLNYKRWTLNVLFDMAQGMDMWNGTKGALAFFGRAAVTGTTTTLTADQAASLVNYNGNTVADQWGAYKNADGSYTVRGEVKNFGGKDVFLDEYWYRAGPGSGFTGPTEQFVEDASWSRLREVTLSYSIPVKSGFIKGATVSFTGRNLLLFTNYTGNDPDQNLTGSGANGLGDGLGTNAIGLDYFNNPATRSYRVALNINF